MWSTVHEFRCTACYVMCFEHIRRRIRGVCDHCLYGSESIAELLLLPIYDSVLVSPDLSVISALSQNNRLQFPHSGASGKICLRYTNQATIQRVIKIIAQYLVPQMNFEG